MCLKQKDRVPLALPGRYERRDRFKAFNAAAELLAYLATRRRFRGFKRPDSTARKHEQVAATVAIADEQQFVLGIEQHHFHAARAGPKQAPQPLLQRVSEA